jgi:hypothetical protein
VNNVEPVFEGALPKVGVVDVAGVLSAFANKLFELVELVLALLLPLPNEDMVDPENRLLEGVVPLPKPETDVFVPSALPWALLMFWTEALPKRLLVGAGLPDVAGLKILVNVGVAGLLTSDEAGESVDAAGLLAAPRKEMLLLLGVADALLLPLPNLNGVDGFADGVSGCVLPNLNPPPGVEAAAVLLVPKENGVFCVVAPGLVLPNVDWFVGVEAVAGLVLPNRDPLLGVDGVTVPVLPFAPA